MKNLIIQFGLILMGVLTMESCEQKNLSNNENPNPINSEQNSTEIEVKIFERINIGYDSEGWPIELGEMKEVKNFQEVKTHELNKYDYIEKIQLSGNFINAKIRFINTEKGCIVNELSNLNSKTPIEFIGPNPNPELDIKYDEWMLNAKWHSLTIEVINDQKVVFEGFISNKKNI